MRDAALPLAPDAFAASLCLEHLLMHPDEAAYPDYSITFDVALEACHTTGCDDAERALHLMALAEHER